MRSRQGGKAALFAAALLGGTCGTAPAARAQGAVEPMLDLTWTVPDECPARDRVVAHVEELVGRAPAGHRTLSARGRVTATTARGASRFRLDLYVGESASPRTLGNDDCARLADAAALVLALDIDPGALAHGPNEPAPPESAPEPAPVPRPRPEPAPSPVARRAARKDALEGGIGARFVLDSGSLPRTTLGLGAVVTLERGPLALELQGAAYVSRFTVDGPHDGVGGAVIGLATLGALGCWQRPGRVVGLRGCLGGEVGRESTRGVNIAVRRAAASLWGALGATLAARAWPSARASPTVGLAILHPVSAARVEIQGVGTVFEPAALVLRGFLGIEGDFF